MPTVVANEGDHWQQLPLNWPPVLDVDAEWGNEVVKDSPVVSPADRALVVTTLQMVFYLLLLCVIYRHLCYLRARSYVLRSSVV